MMSKRESVLDLCRKYRANPTPGEHKMWQFLRNRGLEGLHFRRQHPIYFRDGGAFESVYIVDFYCAENRLVIELDGAVHQGREQEDGLRDQRLASMGYRVLRFWNSELDDMENVLQRILDFS